MNTRFLDTHDVVAGFVPINIGSARQGDAVSMKNWGRCLILFIAAAGPAGDDPTLTVEQCTAIAPSNAKALNFTRVDVKQGTLTAVGTWTKVTQAAGNTYTDDESAEVQKIWAVEIAAEDLDVDNGYDCIQASVGDAGTATQIGALLYILSEPRFAKEGGISAIVD
jgi:hypothetical protein